MINYAENYNYPLSPLDRRSYVVTAYNGDTIRLIYQLSLMSGIPVTPENSTVTFTIRDQRFSTESLWTGTWRNGIEPLTARPGLVEVKIPGDTTSALRRGAYIFSITVVDIVTLDTQLIIEGNLFIDCSATTPNRNIPYRDDSV